MFESSRIINILHLGILNSISKIGLNTQILFKKLKITLLKIPRFFQFDRLLLILIKLSTVNFYCKTLF
ncbi:hypothetical protein ACO2J1_14360 [Leptospira interrogans]|uniref:Uncharacterized protein n=14 Tax=Leptospira interrogans TaxID=173 RepID=A0AAP9W8Z3_LEPIR|nr:MULTISPECIES: hypothetical protein [Leptospira]EMG21496.1 hypothetical protein LEP1GSC150_4783 [Leptospira interrogans serovar Copenhageni str. LT2050]EMM93390.1 hypothetical protein LEP1GSC158_4373 [Leptospira interrogans serovar Zanoni str. LT2156]EMP04694.1 hypothetical protein LEP1GSC124_3069 [Leptospira interrogans serovar Pyrogenes str. 200701872]EMY04164.1 hypothetical protein LEP1GSC029_2271 [Leptospira interrogans str. 2002000626]EMY26170.1 hypothetical protein LEP1GSC115_5320 [Lep